MIDQKIFKAYDVRGVYPEEINEDVAYKIGWAFVEFLKNNNELGSRQIIVGRDARLSSDALFEALSQGIISQGIDVIDLGYVSTPLLYWAVINEGVDGGIIITASHNPAQYNGFKFCGLSAKPIGLGSGLEKVRDLALGKEEIPVSFSAGKISQKRLLDEYINSIQKQTDLSQLKPLEIIIDCGNGMMGPEVEMLIKKLPCRAEILFSEPDGNFPNHEANPIKEETLETLKEKVLSEKANLGIAFDGDGDRIGFLDERGEKIRGDFITAIIAQELLKENRGQKILYEVRSSKAVRETIEKSGGIPVLGRAGHALIKDQMRKEDIFFAGELSGHYFFKQLGIIDNALFAMLLVLKIISQEDKPISEIVKPFQKYYQSGEINFEVENKEEILKSLEEKYSSADKILKIDGLTAEFKDWWFNVRPSNTEPLLRLNIEAESEDLLEEKTKELKSLFL
ncbi:MAG: phosphomannomutase/phosphoglucomutase [Candidatus Portnoybacteria bacterium]|nr:phosphomannomutase/phosphoglucomutase [Candidatus Portnoybacteria bacterium]